MQNSSKHYIYKITNIYNKKVYIGQTKNQVTRKYQHFYDLRNNKHKNQYLQNSFNKHGEKEFTFEVIEECNYENVDERERYWIKQYNSTNRKYGYNIEEGGCATKTLSQFTRNKISKKARERFQNPLERQKASEKAIKRFQDPKERERLSQINKGRVHNDEFRMKISQIHKGRKRPKSTRDAISKAISNYVKTPEHCKNISKSKTGTNLGGEHYRSKKVICLDNEMIFDSLRDAWEYFGVSKSTIRGACQRKGRVKAHDGKYYCVMYYEDYINGETHNSFNI